MTSEREIAGEGYGKGKMGGDTLPQQKQRQKSFHPCWASLVTIPHWLQDPGFIGLWKFIMFQDEYPVGPWRSHWKIAAVHEGKQWVLEDLRMEVK